MKALPLAIIMALPLIAQESEPQQAVSGLPVSLTRFDADKDGVISPKEKSAAARALSTERANLSEHKEELLAERTSLSKAKSQNQIALADAYSMRMP